MVKGKNVGGYYSKFNAAYAFGGPECAIMAITETFGIDVQHVIVADFKGFKTVVNALGGVEVCLAEPAYDRSSKLDLPAGRQTISGEDALAFVRARKGIADGSDISRSERQKMFLGSIIRTAEQSGLLTDPVRLYKVLDAATKSLSMDEELASIGALSGLALEIKSVGSKNIQFVALPWKSRGDGSIELTSAADAILEAFRTSTLPILDLSKKASPATTASTSPSPSTSASGKPGIPTGTPSPSPSALLGFDASQDPCSKPIK
jgi:LCP family protein required for cell wall assembly